MILPCAWVTFQLYDHMSLYCRHSYCMQLSLYKHHLNTINDCIQNYMKHGAYSKLHQHISQHIKSADETNSETYFLLISSIFLSSYNHVVQNLLHFTNHYHSLALLCCINFRLTGILPLFLCHYLFCVMLFFWLVLEHAGHICVIFLVPPDLP